MESRIEKAVENHKEGYNCAQAVACAYCGLTGADEAMVFQMMEGYGAGMGGMECTCGAVSGAVALAGLKNSSGSVKNPTKGAIISCPGNWCAAFRRRTVLLSAES